jgi:hypothetical protein
MKRITRSLCGAVFFASVAAPAFADEIGPAIRDVPIFDAHIHYKEPAWGPYPVKTVIELMDRSGVAMALVSSTPDDGTIRLWEYAPRRIVPELRPYHGDAGSSNWTKSAGMLSYIRGRLAKYPHEGIGEFHIHNLDPDDRPLLTEIARMAKARNIIIHVHSGAAPVRLLYELEPALTILWAHAGMSEPPDVVGPMLDTYKTLYADTSYRENDILRGDAIDPAWLKVINRHSDRLMVGTDTWVNSQWDDYEGLIALNRAWLAKLPRPIAERIAYKNAAKLFKRQVSRDLLGKR